MKSCQIISLDKKRKRKIYSLFPLTIVDDIFVWTGKWFGRVIIEEEKIKSRYKNFDEWNYGFYWSDWEYTWGFVKIIK